MKSHRADKLRCQLWLALRPVPGPGVPAPNQVSRGLAYVGYVRRRTRTLDRAAGGPNNDRRKMNGADVDMKGQETKEPEVRRRALKSLQSSRARRRQEALIQAEVRRLARSDGRKATRRQDPPRAAEGGSMDPAA
jgi:hypothetical protein